MIYFMNNLNVLLYRQIYWTNWNDNHASIQKSYINGLGMETIINTKIHTPNGLTIDYVSRKLYWSDARFDKIERCEYDGSNRQVCK